MTAAIDSVAAHLKRLPEGAILKRAFQALVGVAALMVATDLREMIVNPRTGAGLGPIASPATQPVRMDRPAPNDQVRPYLPVTRPLAPGEEPPRRDRQRDASEAAPMTLRLGTHGAAFADGTIVAGSGEAFAEFLDQERAASVTEIVLHSPGGSVGDATAMAKLIRQKGLGTRILADGYCASSCPIVFAGGVDRIADATAWIGVHQVFAPTSTIGSLAQGMDDAQRISAETQTLLIELGVDPRVWTHAMSTPKDKLYLFTPDELSELRLATKVENASAAKPNAGS